MNTRNVGLNLYGNPFRVSGNSANLWSMNHTYSPLVALDSSETSLSPPGGPGTGFRPSFIAFLISAAFQTAYFCFCSSWWRMNKSTNRENRGYMDTGKHVFFLKFTKWKNAGRTVIVMQKDEYSILPWYDGNSHQAGVHQTD